MQELPASSPLEAWAPRGADGESANWRRQALPETLNTHKPPMPPPPLWNDAEEPTAADASPAPAAAAASCMSGTKFAGPPQGPVCVSDGEAPHRFAAAANLAAGTAAARLGNLGLAGCAAAADGRPAVLPVAQSVSALQAPEPRAVSIAALAAQMRSSEPGGARSWRLDDLDLDYFDARADLDDPQEGYKNERAEGIAAAAACGGPQRHCLSRSLGQPHLRLGTPAAAEPTDLPPSHPELCGARRGTLRGWPVSGDSSCYSMSSSASASDGVWGLGSGCGENVWRAPEVVQAAVPRRVFQLLASFGAGLGAGGTVAAASAAAANGGDPETATAVDRASLHAKMISFMSGGDEGDDDVPPPEGCSCGWSLRWWRRWGFAGVPSPPPPALAVRRLRDPAMGRVGGVGTGLLHAAATQAGAAGGSCSSPDRVAWPPVQIDRPLGVKKLLLHLGGGSRPSDAPPPPPLPRPVLGQPSLGEGLSFRAARSGGGTATVMPRLELLPPASTSVTASVTATVSGGHRFVVVDLHKLRQGGVGGGSDGGAGSGDEAGDEAQWAKCLFHVSGDVPTTPEVAASYSEPGQPLRGARGAGGCGASEDSAACTQAPATLGVQVIDAEDGAAWG